ncbi:hypothetical protein [Jejuia pallidilutea]|uniref:Lipoprotein n=1 Tax=Jejuia pallidilutea TaxID=504487 RepID=A0A090WP20_9FLAO|nr:hypothetical protein [Jejuia pallidilutea]GAL69182.1 hypothetical protein JCM19301_1773 [Jejuia pallidilutea]GAL73421.1 hypothetical protein JCM19302_1340 [Jejuia pallidilutea]GAL89731.1 hypothetical protein JCM19538_3303 [Jejuia pallidilutea]
MKKFNYLLVCILLLLFNCNQAYINENLSQEKQPLEEGKFNRDFPIYLKLSDNSEKKGDFVIKTSVGEQ